MVFFFDCLVLGWIGGKSIETPYYEIGQFATIFYFLYFYLIFFFDHYLVHESFMSKKFFFLFKNSFNINNFSLTSNAMFIDNPKMLSKLYFFQKKLTLENWVLLTKYSIIIFKQNIYKNKKFLSLIQNFLFFQNSKEYFIQTEVWSKNNDLFIYVYNLILPYSYLIKFFQFILRMNLDLFLKELKIVEEDYKPEFKYLKRKGKKKQISDYFYGLMATGENLIDNFIIILEPYKSFFNNFLQIYDKLVKFGLFLIKRQRILRNNIIIYIICKFYSDFSERFFILLNENKSNLSLTLDKFFAERLERIKFSSAYPYYSHVYGRLKHYVRFFKMHFLVSIIEKLLGESINVSEEIRAASDWAVYRIYKNKFILPLKTFLRNRLKF